MRSSSLPKEFCELLNTADQFASSAALIFPYLANGTALFDQEDGQTAVRGVFFPRKKKIRISENERCQLILSKLNIVFNVTMCPCRMEEPNLEYFRFELVDWEFMEQSGTKPATSTVFVGEEAA